MAMHTMAPLTMAITYYGYILTMAILTGAHRLLQHAGGRRRTAGAAAGPARGIAIVSIALVSVVSTALLRDQPEVLGTVLQPQP